MTQHTNNTNITQQEFNRLEEQKAQQRAKELGVVSKWQPLVLPTKK